MKKILLVNECSVLSTGYSKYGRSLLQGLYDSDKYEIAELATCIDPADEKRQHLLAELSQIPWKIYFNHPKKEEKQVFEANPINQFGAFKFNEVCLDFKPDCVLSIRDFWMEEWIGSSPFRHIFKWIWMPTCDAFPQNYQWLHIYSECDALLSYTDWAGELIQKQAGGKINYIGSAPSNIRPNFLPLDNSELKQSWGLSQYRILGTVMRNQRRKLFPDLFEGFRLFLDQSRRTDVLLYAHTSYPDWGWNFPDLLQKYNLSNRVLFTYICENCRYAFPSFFKDSISYCPKCKKMAAGLTGPNRGVSDDVLCRIYNLFDYYIQYANSEGEGVPQLEAAACGIPLIAINYSGMNDVISKIDGCKLQPLSFYNELETGCYRAIPDNKELSDKLVELFDLPNEEYQKLRTSTLENFRYHYSFDKTVGTWMKAIDSLDNANWNAPPKLSQLDSNPPKGDNTVFAKWLICNVLGEPERLGSYMHLRLLRDLNWGISEGGTHGMYYNEDSSLFQQKNYKEFNRKIAYQHFASMAELRNRWERIRCS